MIRKAEERNVRASAIAIDFDGTIVESVGIKDMAFDELFAKYPKQREAIRRYHLAHNATVRFDKFRHIVENILGMRYAPEMEEELAARFSQLVLNRIIECPYVRGAREFLEHYCGNVPIYVVSVTPAAEFEQILAARDLAKYFARVYTVPWKKSDALNDIISRESASPEAVIFIGDSYEDYKAARSAGTRFIGRNSGKSFRGATIKMIDGLDEIVGYIIAERKPAADCAKSARRGGRR